MKVTTNTPVLFDGKMIKPGSTIDVDTATGEQLIESGSAEAAGKAKRDADAGGAASGEADKTGA